MGYKRVMAEPLDVRLLRHFVAVAEELHFSRAAARLFMAQQALSRDVQRLEARLGMRLLDRTTRRVVLTREGEALLRRARPFLAHHDELLESLTEGQGRFVVDVVHDQTTPARVLEEARVDERGFEFYLHDSGGLGQMLRLMAAGSLDAGFARWDAAVAIETGIRHVHHRIVRMEPMALLLPQEHALAPVSEIPVAALSGLTVCRRAGNHVSPEWDTLAVRFLRRFGAEPAEDHPYVRGTSHLVHHVRPDEPPVLTVVDHATVPGAVVRPLVDPVPIYPWSLVWRASAPGPGVDALHDAVDRLASDEDWLTLPDDVWLPD